MRPVIAYVIGVVFGTGIAISGMANPAKVINFFDVAGAWDPSLACVMVSALAVTGIGYRIAFKRQAPVWARAFHLPTGKDIDLSLLMGAGLFGIGWGVAGFCPGGAIPALGTMNADVVVFCAALVAGILIAKALQNPSACLGSNATSQTDG